MKKHLILLISLCSLSSCYLSDEKSPLKVFNKRGFNPNSAEADQRRRALLVEEKDYEWKEIQAEAIENFKTIEHIVRKMCFDCHDSKTKLPFYGRAFPRINPVNRHQVEGLEALDFVTKFPLKSLGSDNQLALLKAFRNSVVEKNMPLKSYTLIYRSRKIKKKDQEILLDWIDPLIEKLENFDEKYAEIIFDSTPAGKAKSILSVKCFRCHANGASKGNFGGMENLEALKKSKYVDLDKPTQSELYTISLSNEMPPNIKESLTEDELETILLWIQNQSE